ncbi:MAG: TetR/AcrR family transcriptional regulator [Pseudoxanthomonas sp.]
MRDFGKSAGEAGRAAIRRSLKWNDDHNIMTVLQRRGVRMRYDGEHKQQTRAKVLDAAARAIRIAGPDRVGVAGVMAEAGLTHGGFYAHFASKDELVVAAIERMFEQARAHFARETDGKAPADALRAYIDFYLSKRHRDMREIGCPMPALASDLPRLGDDARAVYAAGVRSLVARLRDLLAQLGHADAEAEARSAVAELIGALSISRVEPDPRRSDAVLAHSRTALKRRFGVESIA